MQIGDIEIGDNPPHVVNAIIEIPAQSGPVKYELDKNSGAIYVDRFINVPMYYPCNYGFIPHTLSEDGDPVDVLVATPVPVLTGAVIACRPVGGLEMTDESGRDIKLLAVPAAKMNGGYDDVASIFDLPEAIRLQIEHFFRYYKKLESGKWVEIGEWFEIEIAHQEIRSSIRRYPSS